jgi:hypothetical protein
MSLFSADHVVLPILDRLTLQNSHYCDGRHYWIMLFVAENQSITLIDNKIYNGSGRSPELGKQSTASSGGTVHVVNNLYDQNYYMGIRTSDDVLSFVDGNCFANTGLYFLPIFKSADTNLIYAPMDATTVAANVDCLASLGRNCSSNFAAPTAADFILNANVVPKLQASSALRSAIGSVHPLGHSTVPSRLNGYVGPQADPDN